MSNPTAFLESAKNIYKKIISPNGLKHIITFATPMSRVSGRRGLTGPTAPPPRLGVDDIISSLAGVRLFMFEHADGIGTGSE